MTILPEVTRKLSVSLSKKKTKITNKRINLNETHSPNKLQNTLKINKFYLKLLNLLSRRVSEAGDTQQYT
jgi:hypothetical protein